MARHMDRVRRQRNTERLSLDLEKKHAARAVQDLLVHYPKFIINGYILRIKNAKSSNEIAVIMTEVREKV